MKVKNEISSFLAFLQFLGKASVNSYGMLFFSRQLFFSLLIFIVSFIVFPIGWAGLLSLIIAIVTGYLLGFDKQQLVTGIFSYSAILFGFGFAANYETGFSFYLMLTIGSVLSLLFSVAVSSKLSRSNLPGLSLAFIFTTWLVVLSSRQFAGLGLTQRHIYWVNEAYDMGGHYLVHWIQTIENIELPTFVSGFLKSMSAIIFQGNITTGFLLTIGLLIHSRISFMLAVLGYAVALWFNQLLGGFNSGDISYYNLGTNFMLVSIALGGFYIIPSVRSFLWTLITVPIAYLMVVGLGSITYPYALPVFSLPFCITVILFIYCLQLRKKTGKLTLTPIQYYSPEKNIYHYLNGKSRLTNSRYFQLSLPVMGEWMVSQGYHGAFTHKGDWSFALDFVLLDEEMKTFTLPATQPEHFYCYQKPVLSPGDGIVEEVIDYVEDNEIGKTNIHQNWGNTILIKHANGLYSKLSHLKKHSFKVSKGAYVKRGEIIAYCGNSGRSPEPHLHFQVQATPYLGSKTIQYPISHFYSKSNKGLTFESYAVPREGAFVSNINTNKKLIDAFDFKPGMKFELSSLQGNLETWEVHTDEYNQTYLYSKTTESIAYFYNDGTVFYFTDFVGNKTSLLYAFYLCAYKILLETEYALPLRDEFPITIANSGPLKWLQDLFAPFVLFIENKYESCIQQTTGMLADDDITIASSLKRSFFKMTSVTSEGQLKIHKGNISSFSWNDKKNKIEATCTKSG